MLQMCEINLISLTLRNKVYVLYTAENIAFLRSP